jgi:hypothetical protein
MRCCDDYWNTRRGVLSDVGQPEHVGSVHGEVALDQVLFGGRIDQVLLASLGPGQALDAQLAHDGEDQLLVHHHVLLTHQGGSDAQHPIGPSGALVDVSHEPAEQQPPDLAVRGHVVLELVEA